ncbi:MAG: hydantoinase B/oxoprolinase family protein [Dethiobacter sp.]|jgi:N-methylhydantoinase B|nr:MAG: hydantoinase B/oxoprolinase family protein [Dethiobacter sp.]
MKSEKFSRELDPVTFEVLKNGFINLVDQMAEQILRTCYSFVIYCRDFSCCLNDSEGDTVMQGSWDIAVHVGTLHFTAKSVINAFKGNINPGDVFAVNDPYAGGTHFCDVRIIRPVFFDGELIAFMQCNGHWADVGGSVPGSFDIRAKEHYGEGLRIPPIKLWEKGVYREDVANLLVSNMRGPEDRLGDMRAQAEATRVGEQQLLRLLEKYGKDTVLQAFEECKNYVERITRARIKELPEGTWIAEDYIDMDPDVGEGLIPIRVSLTIKDGHLHYDLEGSHPYIGCFLNATFGSAYSAVIAGTKMLFPDIPLSSGFYRVVTANLPEGTVVNAPWPIAVTGFCSGAYEKIMNAIFEIWSNIMPERAMAPCFNLEYLLIGGWDNRPGYNYHFMWYDWMAGGHGARWDRDGSNCSAPMFGVGLTVQPCEGQERLTPVVTSRHEILVDSGGPGKYRGGCGVVKGGTLGLVDRSVMSYCCDRARAINMGVSGGLPSYPHGVRLNPDTEIEKYLGAVFSNYPVKRGESFVRPSQGGGGLGDPMERDLARVLEDVIDGYVTVERARKDYGVIIRVIDEDLCQYEVDKDASAKERASIKEHRAGWLEEDPSLVREKYLKGEIEFIDLFRRYGVILDWETNELLPKTTEQFRNKLKKNALQYWKK